MKGNNSSFLIILAVISILALSGIFVMGITKKKSNQPDINKSNVLGDTIASVKSGSSFGNIKDSVQNTINSTIDTTKVMFTAKMTEAEKTVIESLNREVTNLTKSQVETLKIQICRDLGVLPTFTPTP